MSEPSAIRRITDAEADFIRRGLTHPLDSAVGAGVSGINWILDRWKAVDPLFSEFRSLREFLDHFVEVIGPAARAQISPFGWDLWHLPSTLIKEEVIKGNPPDTVDATVRTYEAPEEIRDNSTAILDARLMDVIERLRREFPFATVYQAIAADPPLVIPRTRDPLPDELEAAAAARRFARQRTRRQKARDARLGREAKQAAADQWMVKKAEQHLAEKGEKLPRPEGIEASVAEGYGKRAAGRAYTNLPDKLRRGRGRPG